MARLTIDQIMQSIAATVNQEASSPSAGSTEYNLWLEYINRSIEEWSTSHDWEELRKIYYPVVTGYTNATVTLPNDYRKLSAAPRLYIVGDDDEGEEFPEITDETQGLYSSEEKYFYETGNPSNGYSLVFHPGTLASGASLEVPYFSTPTALASPAQIPDVPDAQFLIDRTIAYILEARSDPRFQQQESRAREKLLQMVENANLQKFNSYGNPEYVQNGPLRRRNWRIGRD